jgi:hypothetical protein
MICALVAGTAFTATAQTYRRYHRRANYDRR